jgi:hypothetical protein
MKMLGIIVAFVLVVGVSGCGSIAVSNPTLIPETGMTFIPASDAIIPPVAMEAVVDLSNLSQLPVPFQGSRSVWILMNATVKPTAE